MTVSAKGGGRPVGGGGIRPGSSNEGFLQSEEAPARGRSSAARVRVYSQRREAVSPWRDHGGAIVRRDYSSHKSEGAGSSHKVYTVRAYLRLGAPLLLVPAAQLRQTGHAREGHPLGRPRLRPRRRRRRRRRPRLRPPGQRVPGGPQGPTRPATGAAGLSPPEVGSSVDAEWA